MIHRSPAKQLTVLITTRSWVISITDLGIVLAPWYKEHENIYEDDLLDEDEMYWEAHIHARDVETLRDPEQSTEYKFDTVVGFED